MENGIVTQGSVAVTHDLVSEAQRVVDRRRQQVAVAVKIVVSIAALRSLGGAKAALKLPQDEGIADNRVTSQ